MKKYGPGFLLSSGSVQESAFFISLQQLSAPYFLRFLRMIFRPRPFCRRDGSIFWEPMKWGMIFFPWC